LLLVGGVALVGDLENGVLSTGNAWSWLNGPRCFRSRSGPTLPVLSRYSLPTSRIDGHVLEPAHQSIPDLQIEADAMKTKASAHDGHVPRAESARNPSRRRKSAHHSSRQLPRQGPPASWQGKPYLDKPPLLIKNQRPEACARPSKASQAPAAPPAGPVATNSERAARALLRRQVHLNKRFWVPARLYVRQRGTAEVAVVKGRQPHLRCRWKRGAPDRENQTDNHTLRARRC
jgi:hypothetical protein